MSVPAALPAVAILLGTAAAWWCTSLAACWPAALAAAAWAAALVAFRCRRDGPFALAVFLAFVAGAWALSIRAFREVETPPLRASLADRLPSPSPVPVEGRLRSDAALAPTGIALALDVAGVDGSEGQGAGGGVRLAVAGTLAVSRMSGWTAGRSIRASASLRAPGRWLDPGVPDSRLELARRGTVLVGSVKSGALVEVVRPGSWFEEQAARARRFAREALGRYVGRWSAQSAAIVVAILIGDRVGLDDEVQQRLREAGTYHVIAISGGNIAILAALLFGLLRLARVPTRLACWLVVAGLSAYASLVGGGASVVRATMMATAYLVARQGDYRSPPLNALGAACAAILLATPLALVDVGFALTFGATLGILVGARLLSRRMRAPAALLVASLSAELALFPVSAYAFSRVTFAGLLLNFAAIPLMSVAQVAGMAVLPLAALHAGAASLAGWAAHLGAEGLVRSAGLLDFAPWLSWRLPPPHPAALVCYYTALGLWLALRERRDGTTPWPRLRAGIIATPVRRRRLRATCLAVVVLAGAWILTEPVTLLWPGVSNRLRLTVLDVGHADSILVQLPDRRSLLVDTGGSSIASSFDVGGRVIAPALWSLGTRRLEALVLSHGDPDHVGGAMSVLADFRPREVWEGVPVPRAATLARLREEAVRVGAAWRERREGEILRFGEVSIVVHHPPVPEWERQKVRNDDSIVLEVRYRDVSIVLPGDIGRGVERVIAAGFRAAPLRVLKVPHHGSATSSSQEFLDALRPTVAIISASGSSRVSEEVLARYHALGTALFRTSEEGAVTVTTDGQRMVVETMTGRRWCRSIHPP